MVQAVVGANWGDEGKGKIVDTLSDHADIVVRYQGGANAGHTIVNQYGKFALHTLPSGVCHPACTNVLGNGVALNIPLVTKEIEELVARGVPKPHVRISDRAQIVMSYHINFDAYEEERLGGKSFGSTKSGIAPFFSDKYAKIGFQVCELFDEEILKEKVHRVCELKNVLLEHLYHKPLLKEADLLEELHTYRDMVHPYVTDTASFLQQAIREELRRRGIDRDCVTVITQVRVDPDDPGFQNPTKPVGSFYTKEQAEKMAVNKGLKFVEDAGRGYRRVVPSPEPREIVELRVVRQLVEAGDIVITVGGGGIPVVQTPQGLQGVSAVIDKDRASALLAKDLQADRLIILTAVDRVCIDFGKPSQRSLSEMSIADCERYIAQGQFAPGSMLPKVESCMDFVRGRPGGKAVICSLARAAEALEGKTGTLIHE